MSGKAKILMLGACLTTSTLIAYFFFNPPHSKPVYNRFVSEEAFKRNLIKQIQWTPQTLEALRKYKINKDSELKVEYYFYTNTLNKAKELARELGKLDYAVECEKDITDKTQYVITGNTNEMKMNKEELLNWTRNMCELGYKYDCDFDGWEVYLANKDSLAK
jgi:regulator of RNase E activity RraB